MTPETIANRYEVLRPLGRGGMGDVLLVRDQRDGREVALKRLHLKDEEAASRFRDEFATLARIEHPNIVRVFDYGVLPNAGAGAYFTMEYLPGKPIDEAIGPGEITPALAAFQDISAGLRALHVAGLVHCDLKPSNVMIVEGPEGAPCARLLDFGLAGQLGELGTPVGSDPAILGEASATRVRGTLGYVAPEVLEGGPYTESSDLYALGATLYRVLAGTPAYPGLPAAVVARQRAGRPSALPLRAAGVPSSLESAILRLFAEDPESRLRAKADLDRIATRHGNRGGSRVVRGRGSLVGRDDERRRALRHLQSGEFPLVALVGPHGSGRSRLAREIAIQTELDGREVRWVHRGTGLGSPPPGSAARNLWVFDDLDEWSDSEIAALDLRGLSPDSMFVVTIAPAQRQGGWRRAFLSLRREPELLELTIRELSTDEIGVLIRGRLGSGPIEATRDLLARRSGGLPAALHAALDRLEDSGALRWERQTWILDATQADDVLHSPAEVASGSNADDPVQELDPELRSLALALAHVLRATPAEEVATRASVNPDEIVDRLEALAWNGLARVEEGGWCCVSDSVADRIRQMWLPSASRDLRETMRAALITDVRLLREGPGSAPDEAPRRLRAAFLLVDLERLEQRQDRAFDHMADALLLGSTVESAQLSRAVELLVETHDPSSDEETARLIEIARRMTNHGIAREAEPLWRRALESLPESGDSSRLLATVELAAAQHVRGRAQDALATLESIDPPDGKGELAARWYMQRALARQVLRLVDLVEVDYRESIARAPEDMPHLRALCHARLGTFLVFRGVPDRGDVELAHARRLAEETAGTKLARILSHLALVARRRGDLETSLATFRRAADAIEPATDLRFLADTFATIASLHEQVGEWSAADQVSARGEEIARSIRNELALLHFLSDRSVALLAQGRLHELQEVQRAERIWLPLTDRAEPWLHHEWILAEGQVLSGRLMRAETAFKTLIRRAREQKHARYQAFGFIGRARVALLRGRLAPAVQYLRRALDLAAGETRLLETAETLLVRALASEGSALTGVPEPADPSGPIVGTSAQGPSREEHIAWQRALAGDWDGAARQFQSALSSARSRGLVFHVIQATLVIARALVRAGLPAPAREMLRAAHEDARVNGLRIWAQIIAEEMLELSTSPESPPPGDRGDLERDVLYRVSEILNSAFDPPGLIDRALALVCERVSAERGLILLTDRHSDELQPVAFYGVVDEESRASALEVSRTVIRKVASSGEAFQTENASADPRLGSTLSVLDFSMRSLLCVPLRRRDDLIGTIYLENRSAVGTFDVEQLELVEAFANVVAVTLHNARLHDELRRARDRVVTENLSLRNEVASRYRTTNMLGRSAEIEQVLADIEQVAQSRSTVLITGQPGTGKELVAKTIHFSSPRAERPFLALNCAALPEHLIEAELFGIEDHVATGVRQRPGIFERADGGTLFLDEIGDMPLGVQAKLLRVLQEREVSRIGGSKVIRVDVRLIAATNKHLPDLIRNREFRDDLYHRVNTLTIEVPRLRDRKVDIPLLAEHFLQKYCEENGRPVPRIPAALLSNLMRHRWPGNVRELQNYMERCVVMSRSGVLNTRIPLGEGEDAGATSPADRPESRPVSPVPQGGDLKAARASAEREIIVRALQDSGGNQRRAAAVLGMAEPTLRYRMKLLEVQNTRVRKTGRAPKP